MCFTKKNRKRKKNYKIYPEPIIKKKQTKIFLEPENYIIFPQMMYINRRNTMKFNDILNIK